MKRLLTGIASLALVLVGGVALSACGGVKNIVDTSGNYQNVEYAEIQEALTSYKLNAEGYEFIVKFDGGLNADIAQLKGSGYYSGIVESTGNFYLKGDLNMSGSINNEVKISVDTSGDIYVNASTQTAYRNINGKKTQSSIETSETLFESSFSTYGNIIFGGNYDDYFATEITGAEYQMATSNDYVKLMLKTTEETTTDDVVESVTTTFYLIMDAEGNLQGFSMQISSNDENVTIQSKVSTQKVEMPSNTDDYVVA